MKKRLLAVLLLLPLVTVAAFAGGVSEQCPESCAAAPAGEFDDFVPADLAFEEDLPALSAILIDLDSGKTLYEKEADKALPPASVTKVMTMLLVIEAAEAGKISYADEVTASTHASRMGGSQIFLKEGEVMTVEELFKAVSIASANDAAVALAEHVAGSEKAFVSLMNARALELGMKNTNFKNACGLHEEGHVTSARDIALMSRELVKHEQALKYTLVWMDSVRGGEFGLVNTNKLIRTYNGITGLKTGSTSAAKFCMSATASRDSLNLCAVSMGSDTAALRFNCIASLLDFGFANYENARLAEGVALSGMPVKFGTEESVPLRFEAESSGTIPKGRSGELERRVVMEEFLTAPFPEGSRAGRLDVLLDGEIIGSVPIVTEAGVARLTFFKALGRLLSSLSVAG